MKKLILLFVAVLTLVSCHENDSESYTYEFLPTEEVTIPEEEMIIGETYLISMDYVLPTTCDSYDRLFYEKSKLREVVDGETIITEIRTLAIVARTVVTSDSECDDINEEAQTNIEFTPIVAGPYIFKFWVGRDEDGKDVFEEYPVQVSEKN
ncbi:hypothetical protein [Formosa haliotis]|uniref:hypothetical protein n=1 Tax=Formosa haliotis TaxID=1555194 RepID=UPI000826E6A3|nr:hypothetical protein [Formosa haliotis]